MDASRRSTQDFRNSSKQAGYEETECVHVRVTAHLLRPRVHVRWSRFHIFHLPLSGNKQEIIPPT